METRTMTTDRAEHIADALGNQAAAYDGIHEAAALGLHLTRWEFTKAMPEGDDETITVTLAVKFWEVIDELMSELEPESAEFSEGSHS